MPAASAVVRNDAAPIVLQWESACTGHDGRVLDTSDYIVFPMGAWQTPIRVETRAAIAGFKDVSRGIDVGVESVTDMDYVRASL